MATDNANNRSNYWQDRVAILIGLVILFYIMKFGKSIIVPVVSAAFFAILLDPLVEKLQHYKLNRTSAILLSLLGVIMILTGLILLFTTQVNDFANEVPEMNRRLNILSQDIIGFIETNVSMEQQNIDRYIDQGVQNIISKSGSFLGAIVSTTTGFLGFFTLFPISVFFLLYYKNIYKTFLDKVSDKKSDINIIKNRVSRVLQGYIIGMLAVVAILAVLNCIGLLILGINHALFFGIFAALLALIPYIGIVVGSILPTLYAILMYDSIIMPLAVIGIFVFVQFLEGNFITPNIMSAQVSINPLVALIALLIGGQIWGIAGMILFIPMIGMLKAAFDNIENLKPYGYLLGNKTEYQ
mgnify:CR=1 FL=1